MENFRSLETEIHRFKEFFVEETHGIPVLEDCVKHLITRVGKLSICGILSVTYSSVHLVYNAQKGIPI